MPEPHWTAYVTALLTPAVAVFAVHVAASQWTTARNKLRFDLFEKRFTVYQSARDFLGAIMASGTASQEATFKDLQATQAAKWIVGQEVHDYLEREIYKPALALQCLDSELDGMPPGEVRTKKVEKKAELRKHLNAQFEHLDAWFSAYLKLEH
jgi:hypothetical protein